MKKKLLTITTVITIAGTLFFACKKSETCGDKLVAKADDYEKRADIFEKNENATITECNALKAEGLALIEEAKSCSQTSSDTKLLEDLNAELKELACEREAENQALPATLK
ncbi:MAG: hypothetical protein EAZ51_05595 [Sphingobacteriales bacterium]|nr:MAG: hypothetical protein EAZ64_05620 [Sphingobacteriales bacterium]TAF80641.1 MAG: hypothetical protein EAZ51_05595 [Sphingobacteriales bacterium]